VGLFATQPADVDQPHRTGRSHAGGGHYARTAEVIGIDAVIENDPWLRIPRSIPGAPPAALGFRTEDEPIGAPQHPAIQRHLARLLPRENFGGWEERAPGRPATTHGVLGEHDKKPSILIARAQGRDFAPPSEPQEATQRTDRELAPPA